ncbi:MAG: hypothetical protein FRX49_05104 [Trebouxia sp. A1-2]|nr:MAG: hypothetical protein FRX49_05104 [Trebouxia sp. A1-2]
MIASNNDTEEGFPLFLGPTGSAISAVSPAAVRCLGALVLSTVLFGTRLSTLLSPATLSRTLPDFAALSLGLLACVPKEAPAALLSASAPANSAPLDTAKQVAGKIDMTRHPRVWLDRALPDGQTLQSRRHFVMKELGHLLAQPHPKATPQGQEAEMAAPEEGGAGVVVRLDGNALLLLLTLQQPVQADHIPLLLHMRTEFEVFVRGYEHAFRVLLSCLMLDTSAGMRCSTTVALRTPCGEACSRAGYS